MSLPTISRAGVLAGVVAVVIAAVCFRLGLWQLDRLEQRRERNAAFAAALAAPPVELRGEALERVRADPGRYAYRRFRVSGAPEYAAEIVWRGRSLDGRPGVNLLTPLRIEGGDTAVLVNRGWAPSPDGTTVELDSLREPDWGSPLGILIPLVEQPAAGRPRVVELDGERVLTVQAPDPRTLGGHLAFEFPPVYLQQLPGPADPDLPVRLPLPNLEDEGSHFGYAVQWFSFAAIALGGYLILALRARRS